MRFGDFLMTILDVVLINKTLTFSAREERNISAMFPWETTGTHDTLLSAWSSCKIHPSDHKHLGQRKHDEVQRREGKKHQLYINPKNL